MKSTEPIITLSEQIGSKIRQGLVNEALLQIEKIDRKELSWRRMRRHYLAKIKLVEGQYDDSILELQSIINEDGAHILVYADLVAAYFLGGYFAKWQLTVQEFKEQLNSCFTLLHPINHMRAQIILAKSLELTGHIFESYKIFIEISKSSNINFRIKGLTNRVRLEAQYPLNRDFSAHYQILKSFSLENDSPEFKNDVLHSLLLAEAEHISIEGAKKILNLISRSEVCYFPLAYFELLDIWLRREDSALSQLKSEFGEVMPVTFSDRQLLKLAEGVAVDEWYSWPSQMPMSQYLRLLCFLIKKISLKDRHLCISQVNLLTKSLSKESRQIWMHLLKKDGVFESESDVVKITWDKDNGVFLNGHNLQLSKNKLLWNFFMLLIHSGSGEISYSALAEGLWNVSLDVYVEDRIKQLVKRINELSLRTVHCKIMVTSDHRVRLNNSKIYTGE